MGVGNFFGCMPEKMRDSELYGVELDSITGRIAKQLYPKADIQVKGFEKTDFPDNFFDLAIGNVPFGSYGIADKRYDKENFLIHDYRVRKAKHDCCKMRNKNDTDSQQDNFFSVRKRTYNLSPLHLR